MTESRDAIVRKYLASLDDDDTRAHRDRIARAITAHYDRMHCASVAIDVASAPMIDPIDPRRI